MHLAATTARAALVLASTVIVVPSPAARGQSTPAELEGLVRQWVQLERQRGRIETRWIEREAELERQLELLTAEEQVLEELLATSENTQDDVESRRRELLEEQSRLESEQVRLDEQLARAVARLVDFSARLPPPLQADWEAPLDRLTTGNETTSETLDLVLALLEQVREFESRVALHRTTMTLEEAAEVEVSQFYLGLAHGWYVSRSGEHFGAGRSTPEGWRWQAGPTPSLPSPERLRAVVDMLTENREPAWVALPVPLGDAP